MKDILVINGPNLNMLGKRPPEIYGTQTLQDINNLVLEEAKNDFNVEFYQSNYEGDIVTKIQNSLDKFAIIINAGAYTHTSIAIRDALEIFNGKIVEVHLSDPNKREAFRHIDYIKDVADGYFVGLGAASYTEAIKYLLNFK